MPWSEKIIEEVLLPDEQSVLHVLEGSGLSEHYDQALSLSPDNVSAAPVLALRSGKPVQKLLGSQTSSLSYEEGFRLVLAIPIISRHAGGVVLLVHRTEPRTFCKAFIEAHGGVIWAESRLQGTRSSFSLPLVSPAIVERDAH